MRELCPDGGCVGVIDTDGRCNICGTVLPGWGDDRQRGLKVEAEAPADASESPDNDESDDDDDEPADDDENADDDDTSASAPAADNDWAARVLCDNGACVGVIGDDGRCRVCCTRA